MAGAVKPPGARPTGVDWPALVDEHAVRSLLTEDYAHYARPVREALLVFLSGLPRAAQDEIVAAQAALPPAAEPARRLARLAQQCPVLHKLGQSLARDRRLDPALRRELRPLESLPPAVATPVLNAALERELGPLAGHGIRLDPVPIAEASVAVVVGYRDRRRRGVLKVLKPGIDERLALELTLLARVGTHLDERCSELGIPRLGYEETFRQVRDRLSDEVRLDVEQRHLALAADQYSALDGVVVPALHPYCTPRVTAMARIVGPKITDHGRGGAARRRLAVAVASALLAHPLFSTREQVLFHGDPHAGNLLLTPQGRIGILDWSLAGTFGQREREAVLQILAGAMLFDAERVARMLAAFADRRPATPDALLAVARDRLQRLRGGRLPDFDWVIGLLDAAVERAGLRVRDDLLLFRKALHTMQGLVADVGGGRAVDAALSAGFATHLAAEWPLRWWAPPGSRDFATRLSNADLAELLLRSPFAVARSWM